MTRLRIDRTEYTPASERQILSNIVDAMLEAEDKLANATSREWRETIVGYCRQRKGAGHSDPTGVATTC